MKGNVNPAYLAEVRKLYGTWLRDLREAKGMTQEQLAEKMGVSRTTISKVEDGKWNFGIDTLTLFAIHLDTYLFMIDKDSTSDLATDMRDRWQRESDQQ